MPQITPSALALKARYLIEGPLQSLIYDGRIHLPRADPTSGLSSERNREVLLRLSAEITDIAKSQASVSMSNSRITLTTGWCCERWCSVYRLLKSSITVPAENEPLLETSPIDTPFEWPQNIPDPRDANAPLVADTNKIFPWVVVAAVLHEVGHLVNANVNSDAPTIELRCDSFAAKYLLGSQKRQDRPVQLLAVAFWLCCLCSESLSTGAYLGRAHPNPVVRLRAFLTEFVPNDSTLGVAIWVLSVAHIVRLARIHNRPSLDENILTTGYNSHEAFLEDLRHCW